MQPVYSRTSFRGQYQDAAVVFLYIPAVPKLGNGPGKMVNCRVRVTGAQFGQRNATIGPVVTRTDFVDGYEW